MARSPVCPKCQSSMVEGIILDKDHGGSRVSAWVEGLPDRGFFGNVRLRGRKPVEITSWRCTRCGFLESYASG
jgi:RNase P subunit RPR2